jgi:hypothetical protein
MLVILQFEKLRALTSAYTIRREKRELTIAYFPAVPGHVLHFRTIEYKALSTRLDDNAILPFSLELVEELLPNLPSLRLTKVLIVDHDMDSGNDGVIKSP